MANIPNASDTRESGDPRTPRDQLRKAVEIVGALATRCGVHELVSQALSWLFS
ncbi:hypothetical protein GA0061093_13413 [Rhodococcus qingshengii]|jgi:hypothetical protein|nr:hypothetical protein GA0061093_13413 [Rhodococcus qingshengii]